MNQDSITYLFTPNPYMSPSVCPLIRASKANEYNILSPQDLKLNIGNFASPTNR
jgi:hypothetical protein